jgi:transposase
MRQMAGRQAEAQPSTALSSEAGIRVERLGPLPILNRILDRLGLDALLERFVPTTDRRCRLPWSKSLGVLLRSIIVEREAIYRQHETVASFAPDAFGLNPTDIDLLSDDTIGRGLAHLFDADRGTLLTEVVVAAGREFSLTFDELHNDSTSIRFCGQYHSAIGRSIRGRKAPFITYGFSKDHRPDLKQLLFILTTTADGGVPIQFRSEAGNQADVRTHEETWDLLRSIAKHEKFLYVADSKLCGGDAMDHIDKQGGRFVTVLPRSRFEDRNFREWIQTNDPAWETVRDRPHPRRRNAPRDIWKVFVPTLPSKEGWRVVWLFSSLLKIRHEQSRTERLAKTEQELQRILARLSSQRPRRRSRRDIEQQIEKIFLRTHCDRYLKTEVYAVEEHTFRQEHPGRPSEETRYRRRSKTRLLIKWTLDQAKVIYDRRSDGMYPLLTNDATLSAKQVLEAHKRQPAIEKRFEQTKTVFQIAPVFLKNEDRVEALFFLYFLALLVQTLLERELRRAMHRLGIAALPLYPEERKNKRPTAEQILRLFTHVQRYVLIDHGIDVRRFEPQLGDLQRQVLGLLGMSNAYEARA